MIRTNNFARVVPLFKSKKTGSAIHSFFGSKIFGFIISMILLSAMDLSLVPAHRAKLHRSAAVSPSISMVAPPQIARGVEPGANTWWFEYFLVLAIESTFLLWFWRRTQWLEEKLAVVKNDLRSSRSANQLKSLFLANTSHEIRTPLSAILGFTKLLQDAQISNADRDLYISIIQKTGESLNTVINDILDLSKVEAGHLEVEKSKISLRTTLEEVQRLCETRNNNKNIPVRLSWTEGLDDVVYTDPHRVRQILVNVVGNAIKFTEKGDVVLRAVQTDREVFIKVIDTGIGIRQEDQKRLFQCFSQIDTSTLSRTEGTGIGLSLSRNLARLLGGDLRLEYSEPGKGSCFVLILPREVPASLEVLPVAVPSIEKSAGPLIGGKRVLLVDDSEINRLMVRTLLHQKGMHVEIATNGEEAIELAMTEAYDALLMDVQMPVMNGHEATRRLRRMGYDRPIIALTAHAMKEDRDRCLQAGCNDYLSKPIQIELLFSTLARVIEEMAPGRGPLDIQHGQT